MLHTVYRYLVCKQWDLAYVTQLVQSVFCDCGSSEVPVCCRPVYRNPVSSGTWPTSLSSSSQCSVIVVAVRSLCVADCVQNLVCKQWDLAYVTQLVQSVFCDCGSSEVPVCCRLCTGTWCVSSGTWPTSLSSSSLCSVIVVAVRSLCVADRVQEPGV